VVQKRSSRRKRTASRKSEERYSLTCENPHGHVQDTSNGNGHNGKTHSWTFVEVFVEVLFNPHLRFVQSFTSATFGNTHFPVFCTP
jgi:hypothetical protein